MEDKYEPSKIMYESKAIREMIDRMKREEELKAKYFKEIDSLISSGNFEIFSDIEYLIKEWSEELDMQEYFCWYKLKDKVKGDFNINIEIRKLINSKIDKLTIEKAKLEIVKVEGVHENSNTLENPNLKTQTANYLFIHELGIIEYLKNKYSDRILSDMDLAKILCQILRYDNVKEINSMRSLIKDHRNWPTKIETENAKNQVKHIMTFHKLT